MKLDDYSSKFDYVFKAASYLLRSHYDRKFFPRRPRPIQDVVDHWVHFLGVWAIIAGLYLAIVYVFFVDPNSTSLARLADFYHAPPQTLAAIYAKIKDSIFLNLLVLYFAYKAVVAYSLKQYFWDHFVHHRASGLIKVVRVGEFDQDGSFREVSAKDLGLIRSHIRLLIAPPDMDFISIVAASGWDFFGSGPSLPALPKPAEQPQKRWYQLRTKKQQPEAAPQNGYLLDLLRHKSKRFEILLLDPRSQNTHARGDAYCREDAHHPVTDAYSYSDGIVEVCKKLLELQKTNPNIEVRLTNSTPPWRMIFGQGEVWAQPIIPGLRSDHGPLYGYKRGQQSLYHSFFATNETLWHSALKLDGKALATIEADLVKLRTEVSSEGLTKDISVQGPQPIQQSY